jgi:hypothetical protein
MNDNDYDTNNPVDGLSDAGTATRSCRRSIAIGRSGRANGSGSHRDANSCLHHRH